MIAIPVKNLIPRIPLYIDRIATASDNNNLSRWLDLNPRDVKTSLLRLFGDA
jgi:hypothetical protein